MNIIRDAHTIVLKVGTSTLTHSTGMLNLRRIESLVKVICDMQNSGHRMILVSSGAVSAGLAKIGFVSRPDTLEEKQAAAAVGQCELMNLYDGIFSRYGHKIAQMLLTRDAVERPVMRTNAEGTFRVLLERGCIPIINENDSVSFEEMNFGGNDTLSAYVAKLAKADLVINMSDVDGLYDSDPRKNPEAKLIGYVEKIDEGIIALAGGAGTSRGTGGMRAKLTAASIATSAGIPMLIINGTDPEILYDICDGKPRGTYFEKQPLPQSE